MNWNTKYPEQENYITLDMLRKTLKQSGYIEVVAPEEVSVVQGAHYVSLNLHNGFASHREATAPVTVHRPTVPSQWIYFIRIR